jgi:hypothetical protein
MGLLRRPTTSGIVEDGRLGRPCGPGAPSRASQTPNLRLRRTQHFARPFRLGKLLRLLEGAHQRRPRSRLAGRGPQNGRSAPRWIDLAHRSATTRSHEPASGVHGVLVIRGYVIGTVTDDDSAAELLASADVKLPLFVSASPGSATRRTPIMSI